MRTHLFYGAILFAVTLFCVASCKKSNGSNNSSTNGTDSATSIYSSTVAGNNSASTFDFGPTGVAAAAQGDVYIAIDGDGYILKLNSSGAISTFAGSKGNFGCEAGTGTAATFTNPYALCIDAQGNIYVADYLCSGINRITPSGVSAKFCSGDIANDVVIDPQAICIDPQGNIYSANQLGEEGIVKTTPGA